MNMDYESAVLLLLGDYHVCGRDRVGHYPSCSADSVLLAPLVFLGYSKEGYPGQN
jgi:hypothetical protein